MHLVGFTIEIYKETRPYERKIHKNMLIYDVKLISINKLTMKDND